METHSFPPLTHVPDGLTICHEPLCEPGDEALTILIEISLICPGVVVGIVTSAGPPICSPSMNLSLYPSQVDVPTFFTRQVLVNAWLGETTVPSGRVMSEIKVAESSLGAGG